MIIHMNVTKDCVKGHISIPRGRNPGDKVEFEISTEYGWQQWGAIQDVLYETMPIVEKIEFMYRNGFLGVKPKEERE